MWRALEISWLLTVHVKSIVCYCGSYNGGTRLRLADVRYLVIYVYRFGLFTKYYSGDKTKKNEMSGSCSTYGREDMHNGV